MVVGLLNRKGVVKLLSGEVVELLSGEGMQGR